MCSLCSARTRRELTFEYAIIRADPSEPLDSWTDRVTLASDLPVAGGTDGTVSVEGKQYTEGSEPNAETRISGSNYFDVLHARLVAGRSFAKTDVLGAPPVMIVNETFVKSTFPNENPIGERVAFFVVRR